MANQAGGSRGATWGAILSVVGIVVLIVGNAVGGDDAGKSALVSGGLMTGIGGLLLIVGVITLVVGLMGRARAG